MSYILTKTPHQKINNMGISSQWEGTHIRFIEPERISYNEIKSKRMYLIFMIQISMIIIFIYNIS